MTTFIRAALIGLMGWVYLGLTVEARGADQLEAALVREAKSIIASLKESGFKNVGVLKFRVKKGDEPATDRAGVLNMRIADKLELALILKSDTRDPIGIVKKASAVAAKIPGASHLTAEGRTKLFTAEYPLAWGNTNVVPDAFLTGVAAISKDLKTMTVAVMSFDKQGGEMKKVSQFDVELDLEDLLDSGESFTVRGIFDSASMQMTSSQRKDKASAEALTSSIDVKQETKESKKPASSKLHPLSPDNKDSPVRLEIRYDNQPQAIEFRDGAAFVAEPREGQKVSFIVHRNGTATPRLGVVLKVNGENTLGREKLPDAQCQCWVFEKNLTKFGVTAFQMTDTTAQEFRVASEAESKSREIDYGEHVGTISITVFPEQTVQPRSDPVSIDEDGEDFAILNNGKQPDKTPSTLGMLKSQLNQVALRALIVEGKTINQSVDKVKFKHDPLPMMTATVRYYNQQDLPQ